MERAFFGGMVALSVVVIAGVHLQQTQERRQMHEGVLRDRERLQAKRSAAADARSSAGSDSAAGS